MEKNADLTTLRIGLPGAALTSCGDRTLYYDRMDFEQNGSLAPIIDIMKKLSRKRMMLGGWIAAASALDSTGSCCPVGRSLPGGRERGHVFSRRADRQPAAA